MELVDFLRARLDEDAELAAAASPGPWHVNAESDEVLAVDDITVAEGFALSGRQLRATTAHIARHDPARVLREIDAKQRIIAEHTVSETSEFEGKTVTVTYCPNCRNDGECPTMRLLALPYADRPGYREEWRP